MVTTPKVNYDHHVCVYINVCPLPSRYVYVLNTVSRFRFCIRGPKTRARQRKSDLSYSSGLSARTRVSFGGALDWTWCTPESVYFEFLPFENEHIIDNSRSIVATKRSKPVVLNLLNDRDPNSPPKTYRDPHGFLHLQERQSLKKT